MRLLILTTTLLMHVVCLAQSTNFQFLQVTPSPPASPIVADLQRVSQQTAHAVADIDGDDDLDILITGYYGGNSITKLYTNEEGVFTEVLNTPFVQVYRGAVAFADIDDDDDLDVLISGYNSAESASSTILYTNDGAGNFTIVENTPFPGVWLPDIDFADIDGDDDLDVVILGREGNGPLHTKLYSNDGSGNFAEVTGTPFVQLYAGTVDFADIDDDEDFDLLVTGYDAYNTSYSLLYKNNGSGVFTSVSHPFNGVQSSAVDFADIDGDEDLDVLISGYDRSLSGAITKLYTNNGTGTYSAVASTPFPNVSSGKIQFTDIDGDLDNDVLITGSNTSNLYTNDGEGNFSLVANTPFYGNSDGDIAFGDLDNDGDIDLLMTGNNQSVIYASDGEGLFTVPTGSPFVGLFQGDVAFGDINGDTFPDAIQTGVTATGERVGVVYVNDGNGGYLEDTEQSIFGGQNSRTKLFDADNDLDLDLIVYGNNGANSTKLYINDGDGNFVEDTQSTFLGLQQGEIAIADIDNDYDLDILMTGLDQTYSWQTKLYSNDGNGGFSEVTEHAIPSVSSGTVTFGDVDSDGDQDVMITGSSGGYIAKVFKNDGNGTFTEYENTSLIGVLNGEILLADIDGDNDQDAFITGYLPQTGYSANLYTNDGNGLFSVLTESSIEGVTQGASLFTDLDGDNDYDLIVTGQGSSNYSTKLYENDGAGNFTMVTDLPIIQVNAGAVAAVDIDGDFDQDVLIMGNTTLGKKSILYRNNTPQVDSDPIFITDENAEVPEGTSSFDVDANDGDGGSPDDGITYSATGGADQTAFTLNTGTGVLTFNTQPDYENAADANNDNVYEIEITANDGAVTSSKTFFIQITDENDESPVFTSSPNPTVSEGSVSVVSLSATDEDANSTITYSITGGSDADLFALSNSTEINFLETPDFENPQDQDGDNSYLLEVTASDGTNESVQAITVTVTDENDEIPLITSPDEASIDEGETEVLLLSSTDLDTNSSATYSVSGGDDMSLFQVSGSTLSFISAPDFENPTDDNGDNVYLVEITVNDGINTASQIISVTVLDVIVLSSLEPMKLSIYPNPASDAFEMKGINAHKIDRIILIGLDGKKVKEFKFRENASYPISDLDSGIYLLLTETGNSKQLRGKLIKE